MKCVIVWLVVLVTCLAAPGGASAEVHYFRRDGGLVEGNWSLPDDFSEDATLVWRTPLLPGNSTPCASGHSILVTTWDQDRQRLATVALDRLTGRVRWTRPAPTKTIEACHEVGSPASCTVACNGEDVFAFFGSYGMLCYDLDGELQWSRRLGPFQDEFGAASSPVLVGNLVVLNEDHDVDSFLVALDQRSGETVWRVSRDEFTRSYSTPAVWDSGVSKQLIVAGSLQLASYDAATGEKLWWVNGLSRIVDPTPVVSGNTIYLATQTAGGDATKRISMEPFPEALANYDTNGDGLIEKSELPAGSPVLVRFFRIDLDGDQRLDRREWNRHAGVFRAARNAALAIRAGGRGDVTEQNVRWVARRGLPTVPSSVVYEGVMYMVRDGGVITGLDATSGEILKQGRARGRGNYYASLVAGDGKVYVAGESGVVTVLAAGRKWATLSSHDFGERIMATPVVAQGRLLIRTDEALYCFAKK
jgi:outer membrane protein assembly factor BamB